MQSDELPNTSTATETISTSFTNSFTGGFTGGFTGSSRRWQPASAWRIITIVACSLSRLDQLLKLNGFSEQPDDKFALFSKVNDATAVIIRIIAAILRARWRRLK